MNELPVKREDTSVSTNVKVWGAAEDMDARDLVLTKIYHQQDTSKLAKARKAEPGDWCDSVTDEVLCKADQVLPLIIFASYKNWQTLKAELNGKYKWFKTERYTVENSGYAFEFEEGNDRFRRRLQYNFFCLLPDRPFELPYVLSFTSTKTPVARKLVTLFKKWEAYNMPSASFIMNLKSVPEKNDGGSWFGIEFKTGAKATAEQFELAESWYKRIKASNVVVDDEHENQGDSTSDEEKPF